MIIANRGGVEILIKEFVHFIVEELEMGDGYFVITDLDDLARIFVDRMKEESITSSRQRANGETEILAG